MPLLFLSQCGKRGKFLFLRKVTSLSNKIQSVCLVDSVSTLLSFAKQNIVMCRGDYRRGLDWWMDLLTPYTHDWELQVITAPSLISTILKSPQHPLSLFPAWCVFTSRSLSTALTVEILQFHALRCSAHSLPCRIDYQLNFSLVYNISSRTT
jgi:hypothetical protein